MASLTNLGSSRELILENVVSLANLATLIGIGRHRCDTGKGRKGLDCNDGVRKEIT